jgi:hypothetical protein
MSATSSVSLLVALAGLAKAVRPLGAHMSAIARASSKNIGTATARALSLSNAGAAELQELPSPARAIAEVNRHEQQAADQLRRQARGLAKIDIDKTAMIAGVLRAPIVADNAERVQAALAAVEASRNQRELTAARRGLLDLVAAEHSDAWLSGLQDITQRAYETIGFRPLQAELRSPREIRTSAVNGDGKVLVSELRLAPDGSPSMATEVVNGCGPECEGILAKFESALAEHVRGSAPVRKPTGGVCQLDAAVAFVKRRVRRAPMKNTSSSPTSRSSSSSTRSRPRRLVVQKRS